jgi:hypothetical protein
MCTSALSASARLPRLTIRTSFEVVSAILSSVHLIVWRPCHDERGMNLSSSQAHSCRGETYRTGKRESEDVSEQLCLSGCW